MGDVMVSLSWRDEACDCAVCPSLEGANPWDTLKQVQSSYFVSGKDLQVIEKSMLHGAPVRVTDFARVIRNNHYAARNL